MYEGHKPGPLAALPTGMRQVLSIFSKALMG